MKIREIIDAGLEMVGFASLKDMILSAFGIKYHIHGIYLFGVTLGAIFTGVYELINKYVYSPADAVVLIFLLTLMDVAFGLAVARVENIRLEPSKFFKGFGRFAVQMFFVSMLYQSSNWWGTVVSIWVVNSLIIVCFFVVFWSAFENAYKLQLIPTHVYQFVKGILDLSELIKKIKPKK